ncbi:T9SS type A sorting domain-containing protein [Hanstruepera marina]|uniref:T9SS type A sorting domain-containing protein n=1 Tax=Hanstruepera marina TaxID=2873265 RepID=UPI001CA7A849|nr:T9SS type A sorting domain-containing protein [Hanstruepera marina]
MKQKLLFTVFTLILIGNTFSQTVWSSYNTVDGDPGENPYAMASGQLDPDSYPDIVVGMLVGNKVLLYKNNGDGTFASSVEIGTLNGVSYIAIADIDGINGNDIIVSSYNDGRLVWYANDGSGNFGTENVISSTVAGAGSIYTGLIDGDSNIDVAVSAYSANKIVWFSNDGGGTFTGGEQTLVSPITEPGDFDMADFDGDGDLDAVVTTAEWANGVIDVYYNNLVPSGTVSFIVDSNNVSNSGNTYLFDVDFVDVDNDGGLDILVSDSYGDFAWYKREVAGTYTKTTITSTIPNPGISEAVDVDGDLKNDLVLSNGATGGDDITWHKAEGAAPTTIGAEQTVDGSGIQKQVYAMTINDFDNDGDQDIASISYQAPSDGVYWIENLLETLDVDDYTLSNEISIYPNPTNNVLNFKSSFNEPINLSIYNLLGQIVLSQTVNNNTVLDVSELSSGLYTIRLNNSNEVIKFIKN